MGLAEGLGGIGSAIGSGIAYDSDEAKQQRAQEEAAQQAALAQLMGVQLPDFDKMKVSAQEIQGNPETRAAQMQALDALMNEGRSGGMTAQDRAASMDAQNEIGSNLRGQSGAIANRYAAMGGAGRGDELAAQLSGQQGAANAYGMAGAHMAASSRQRALEAMAKGGTMAGEARGQDDAISRFNAQMRNNANVYNSGLGQTKYQDQLDLAKARAGGQAGMAAYIREKNRRLMDRYGGTGQAIGTGFGAAGDAALSKSNGGAGGAAADASGGFPGTLTADAGMVG